MFLCQNDHGRRWNTCGQLATPYLYRRKWDTAFVCHRDLSADQFWFSVLSLCMFLFAPFLEYFFWRGFRGPADEIVGQSRNATFRMLAMCNQNCGRALVKTFHLEYRRPFLPFCCFKATPLPPPIYLLAAPLSWALERAEMITTPGKWKDSRAFLQVD